MTIENYVMTIEEANEFPQLKYYDLLYNTNKLSALSEELANAIFSIRPVTYINLTETEQQRVKVMFLDALGTANITIMKNIIDMAENESMFVLASLLRQYGYKVPFESKFTEVVEALQKSEKVTLVKFTDFGFPVAIQTTIDRVDIEPYAQYDESMLIVHKPKGKRKLVGNRILPYEELIIYKGWIDIDVDRLSKTVLTSNEYLTTTITNYTSFDNNFLTDILAAVLIDPIAKINI